METSTQDNIGCDVCAAIKKLEYTNNMLTYIADNSEVGIYVTDFYTCEILYVNRKMLEYGGNKLGPEQVVGRNCWELVNYAGVGRCPFCPYKSLVNSNGERTGPYTWEHYFPTYNMWLKIISDAIRWVDGRLAHIVTFYDITDIKEMQRDLAMLAYIDQLLRIKNGVRLEKDIKESPQKPSLIVFDISSLHKINEAYGRNGGDKLLISIRDWILQSEIENIDLYRIGGDEFCLTVYQSDSKVLSKIVDILSQRFYEPWLLKNTDYDPEEIKVYCNISVAVIHSEFIRDNEAVMNLIERTLNYARNNRKITIYNGKFDSEFKNSLRFELSLKNCVREYMKGFKIYYQPIVNPDSGKWQSLEALCRWDSPEFGSVSPLVFISEAEKLALIDVIGLWTLEYAIVKCKELELDKVEKFVLDVNISAVQFSDELLAEKIIKLLDRYDYPGSSLCLEITESTRFTFTDLSLSTVERLREKNIMVALDDFGTGYSCFNNLNKLPVDILKIEKEFITNIEDDHYQQQLFKAMADLAHTVKMKIIAEGVENIKQVDILKKNGVDFMQGYLFSRPLSPEDLKNNLNNFF